jgi:hypothetical protein
MIKFIEKIDQLQYSQFEIKNYNKKEDIEEYWNKPHRFQEIQNCLDIPVYFQGHQIKMSMELFETFNSI